jgi:TorA maturation chaperone TorD
LNNIQPSDIPALLKNISVAYNNNITDMKISVREFDYLTRADIDSKSLQENLVRHYSEAGIVYSGAMPADHVSHEMSFMGHMRGVCRHYLENDDKSRFFDAIKLQQLFYKGHISVWSSFFSYQVAHMEECVPFYKHIGEMLGIFLREDTILLQKIIDSEE